MNRVLDRAPVKSLMIILVGVGVVVLAVLTALIVVNSGPEISPAAQPAPLEGSAPAAEVSPASSASGREIDRWANDYRDVPQVSAAPAGGSSGREIDRWARDYQGVPQVSAAPAGEASGHEIDRWAHDYHRDYTPVGAAGNEIDLREAGNYRDH